MDFLTDNSRLLLEQSMRCMWTRQDAILNNIANAETPGYQAQNVSFEESLRQKLATAQTGAGSRARVRNVLNRFEPTVTVSAEATRMDGNGVNLTEQNLELTRNAYQLQYALESINRDLAMLRTAVKGQ